MSALGGQLRRSEARVAEGEALVRRLTATLRQYVHRYGAKADAPQEEPRSDESSPARLEQRHSIRFT